jgi:hypothetical protein
MVGNQYCRAHADQLTSSDACAFGNPYHFTMGQHHRQSCECQEISVSVALYY